MTYVERLSILLDNQKLVNIVDNDGPHAVNQYALDMARKAYQYRLSDGEVVRRMITARNGQKAKELYTNGQLVWDYYRKYHDAKYAIGALAMCLLRATNFDEKQTNRIIHRSPIFKFWHNPKNSRPGNSLTIIKWDEPYMTTDTRAPKTHGEILIKEVASKMTQPVEV
mgnify:CR=1 FL=1